MRPILWALLCGLASFASPRPGVQQRVEQYITSWLHAPEPFATKNAPILGNGDLGAVVGGPAHTFTMGKNDFWAFDVQDGYGRVTFTQLAVATITVELLDGPQNASWTATQELYTPRANITTTRISAQGPVSLHSQSFVAADANLLVTSLQCAAPSPAPRPLRVSLHVTPSAYPPPDPTWTNFFGLNSAAGAAPDGALWLRRENNLRTHNPAITAPCGPDVLPYPGLRQWVVGEEGALTLQNGTAPALCLQLLGRPGPVTWLSAVRCAEVPAGERWVARATAGIGAAAPGDGALWVGSPTNASLCAVYRRDVGRLASQPSPVVTPGLCASPGANASALWYWVRASGELRTEDLPGDERGRCLMGVAPNVNLSLGVAVTLAGPDGASAPAPRQVTTDGRGTASVTVPMHCGQSYQLRTAVLTQRDLQWRGGSVAGARALVRRVDAAGLWAGHQRWWSQYWGINGLVLDPALARLQQLWYSLQYLLGSVVRDGRVTPGLWGPFSNQDPVRWNGQITIDMNAEHAFQGIATLNRLPLLRPYLATMTDPGLRAHGRARAGLSSWARGGYFAQHVRGEQVASVACGPQTGWQKKGGCPEAFGGYAGVEFPSAIGPYYGMWLWMDAANHYTAGYAGLPVLEAYEYAPQPPALRAAYCYSREVADFYAAFAVRDNATGRLDLPYSCVNENCLGPWGHATPKNSAFELALARAHLRSSIRYSALLEAMHLDPDCPPASPPQAPTTGPQGPSPATAPSPTTTPAAPEAARREHWAQTLAQLAPYPTTTIPGTDGPVFAAADFPPPRPNVTDLGMVFPAYDPQIHTDPVLRGIARRTAVHQLRAGQSATTPWFLNAAARVLPRDEADGLVPGFDAAVSLLPNGLPKDWANELIGFYTAAINSFLVQVRAGVLHLFPFWPAKSSAAFDNLRIEGAFLISSEWQRGAVRHVRVRSEQGGALRFWNPFRTHPWAALASGEAVALRHERTEEYVLPTAAGLSYIIVEREKDVAEFRTARR